MMFATVVLAFLALTGAFLPALAHDRGPGSWINQQALKDPFSNESCCNLHDCSPTKVREVSGGYIVETGEFVIRERVLWRSQDGQAGMALSQSSDKRNPVFNYATSWELKCLLPKD